MSNEIEKKIKTFCNKGNMNINKLKIIKNEDGYIADDGRASMMFDKNGKPTSLPVNKSSLGPKLGKGLSIIYIAVIIGLVLFCAVGVFVNKFIN